MRRGEKGGTSYPCGDISYRTIVDVCTREGASFDGDGNLEHSVTWGVGAMQDGETESSGKIGDSLEDMEGTEEKSEYQAHNPR
jgi:hypothetical protein